MKKIMKNLFYKRLKLFCHVTKKLIFQTLDASKQGKSFTNSYYSEGIK